MKTKDIAQLLAEAENNLQLDDAKQYSAFLTYKYLGEEGVTEALFEYGRILKFGWLGNVDEEKAFLIFQKGAVRGGVMCQWMLANCYEEGCGVEKDEKKAFFWMKESADGNNPFALSDLSLYYHDGIGTEKDLKKSFQIAKEIADRDSCSNAQAQNNVAFAYLTGEGVEQNFDKAKQYFIRAINSGCQGQYYRDSTIEGARNGNPDDIKMLELCGIGY